MEGSPARSVSSRFIGGSSRSGGSASGVIGDAAPTAFVLAHPLPGDPELLCYCCLPARCLTSPSSCTESNPGRNFLMCPRKFRNGQGCKLWIWEDGLRTYVAAMVLYYTRSASNHSLIEEISSARQAVALKEKQIGDLVEVYEAKLASMREQILQLEAKQVASERSDRGEEVVQSLSPSSMFLAVLVLLLGFFWILVSKH